MKNKIHILYRISNGSYNKVRLDNATKENCLKNALKTFPSNQVSWSLLGDRLNSQTYELINDILKDNSQVNFKEIDGGSGAKSFNIALDEALKLPDNDIVYFIEDDYAHLHGSINILNEGFNLGADYLTLYLHPDKFMSPQHGGNPEVDIDGGYVTKIYRGETELFHMVNSSTMTFSSKVKTLKQDEQILRKWTTGSYPEDYKMFLDLRDNNRVLLCPVNTYSTHLEKMWLAPLYKVKQENLESEWEKHLLQ